jgi:hypothetical protein
MAATPSAQATFLLARSDRLSSLWMRISMSVTWSSSAAVSPLEESEERRDDKERREHKPISEPSLG